MFDINFLPSSTTLRDKKTSTDVCSGYEIATPEEKWKCFFKGWPKI